MLQTRRCGFSHLTSPTLQEQWSVNAHCTPSFSVLALWCSRQRTDRLFFPLLWWARLLTEDISPLHAHPPPRNLKFWKVVSGKWDVHPRSSSTASDNTRIQQFCSQRRVYFLSFLSRLLAPPGQFQATPVLTRWSPGFFFFFWIVKISKLIKSRQFFFFFSPASPSPKRKQERGLTLGRGRDC